MGEPEPVHWHDGLFLLHHHLQFLQQGLIERAAADRLRARAHGWGLVELELDEDALHRSVVAVRRLRAVMPRGMVVEFPGNAALPTRDLRNLFREDPRPVTVSLAIPERSAGGANVAEGEAAAGLRRTWTVAERSWRDENDGGRDEPLLVRRLNARLVTDRDDATDLELLPLLRLKPSSADAAEVVPMHDPDWAPPCWSLRAHPATAAVLEQTAQLLTTRQGELAAEIARSGYSAESLSGALLEQVLRLRSVGAAAGRIDALRQDPGLPPFALYVELRGALGELAALSPGAVQTAAPPYRHEEPLPALRELARRVGNLAASGATGTWDKIPFRALEPGRVWEAAIADEHLLRCEEWYLAATAPGAGAETSRLVGDPDRFKLVPAAMREARVRGVRLSEERKPPASLPALSDTVWFRLAREENPRLWTQIRDDRRCLVVCPQALAGQLGLCLYATRRTGAGA